MSSTRCAVCKHFRRRCPRDCISAPYFLNDNPQRFTCVHRIYGASNIAKMLGETPVHLRADVVDSLYYEAKCRTHDSVYGCAGIISSLHRQIQMAESRLAKAQAEIAIRDSNVVVAEPTRSSVEPLVQQYGIDYGLCDPSYYWFY